MVAYPDLERRRGTALLGQDFSITNAIVLIVSLVLIDVALSLVRARWNAVDKWFSGVPMVLVDNGKLLKDRLVRSRVDESDILESARRLRGLENLQQIRYAVLERDGNLTIIPFPEAQRM